ncbi:S41 family peptidase [Chryseotalea sanaruensis]|uniref:S41 family peptidase n=1 Tax=Chryseotalea sanaruensis TaxID=2482724 RepID=A0A401UFI0_9BACT|nr:S41 family peptidase [Chryseotalea sanaruensis]GCC53678.1 S41 family peptidase [Chryseotalea sanaruensis]
MSKKAKWGVVLVLISIVFAFRSPSEKYFEIARNLDIFATLFKEVNTYYVDTINPAKLIKTGIDGMLESLDPYTDYIPEDQIDNFRISTTGQYAGIGALIGIVNNKTVITHPYKGFPAYKSGLRVGDELLAVDGKAVQSKTTSDVSTLLKGQPKTEVEVKVKRHGPNEELTFKIKREKISVGNVSHYTMLNKNVGYIHLEDFTPGAAKEIAAILLDFKEQGISSLILDLRDNPGGLLNEAVNIVNLFIPKSLDVVSTKGKVEEWNKTYRTLNNPIDTELPLVVLTNENSASASEIVAGSLQDYDRAVLIGRKTFGKGLVQTTRALAYNAQLKVTTAKYYIPSGRCIQAVDYTHRNAQGHAEKVADSLKREFKTKAGRIVFDGAGLDPDFTIAEEGLSSVAEALIISGHIFDYATIFANLNKQPDNLNTFVLNDQQYNDFINWLKVKNFKYTTDLEKNTLDLLASAKSERYFKELEPQLKQLQKQIEIFKTNELLLYRDEIKMLLTQQIAFHYNLAEGQASVALKNDEAVIKASSILTDAIAYKKALTPQ